MGPDGIWRTYPNETPAWTRIHDGSAGAIAATERRVWIEVQTPEGPVLMRSADEGASWTSVRFTLAEEVRIHSLVDTQRGALLAATSAGIFRSVDRGESWTPTGVYLEAPAIAADRRQTYVSDTSGLWTSRDGGASWRKMPVTIEGRSWTPKDQLSRVFEAGGRSAAVINGRLFRIGNGADMFTPAGLDKDVISLVHVRGTWFAATHESVFRSQDFAAWTECSLGLHTRGPLVVIERGDLVKGGAALSTDGCRSWWPLNTRNGGGDRRFIFSRRGALVAMGGGIARLDLVTRIWFDIEEPMALEVTSAVVDDRERHWMGTVHGVYVLMPDAQGWEVFPMGLQHEPIVSLVVDGRGYLIAAVRGRGLFRAALP